MKKLTLKGISSIGFICLVLSNSFVFCQSDSDGKEQIRIAFKNSDANNDGKLNLMELKNFISKYDPFLSDKANEMLLSSETSNIEMLIEEAVEYIFKYQQSKKNPPKITLLGWKGLKISRELGDERSIEGTLIQVPAILSVSISKDKAQNESRKAFNLFGAIQLFEKWKDFGKLKQHVFNFSGGIEADINGVSPTPETSLKFAFRANQFIYLGSRALDGLRMQLDLFWNTDREFKRSVPGFLFSIVPSSYMLRMNYWVPKDFVVKISWIPRFTFEFGKIVDTGSNENLQTRIVNGHESFLCIGFGTQIYLYQELLKDLTFKADFIYKWDIADSGWKSYFFSLFASYPILKVESKNQNASISFAINYRKGEKPPDFTFKNEFLFGFGVTL